MGFADRVGGFVDGGDEHGDPEDYGEQEKQDAADELERAEHGLRLGPDLDDG